MTTVKCFWIEETGTAVQEAMAFCSECGKSTRNQTEEQVPVETKQDWSTLPWPEACEHCGHVFDFSQESKDWRSSGQRHYYRRADTGEVGLVSDFGPGAMWDAHWMGHMGPDGRSLCVRLPGDHDWMIDARASNCNMKDVPHNCWTREGEPPNVSIVPGPPGHSGGGSVWAHQPHGWHGFLKRGWLQEVNDPEPPL